MVNDDKNSNEFCGSQREDLLGRLYSTQFAVQIAHGDFPEGDGHSFKVFFMEKGKRDAHFVMRGEKVPIGLADITGLKVTNEQVGFHPFAHRNWKRTFLIPTGVLFVCTLIAKTHWAISCVATLCSVVASTSLGKKVRFLCDLKDGRYFTAIMPAEGYEVLKRLVES